MARSVVPRGEEDSRRAGANGGDSPPIVEFYCWEISSSRNRFPDLGFRRCESFQHLPYLTRVRVSLVVKDARYGYV